MLEPRGYEILAASNAEQALRIAAKSLPDLILLDVVMPGTDGFAVCRQLKETEATRAIPVLFVTAKDETESLLRGFRCGAVDYIPKPFQAEEVLVRVETHLKIARLTRELIDAEPRARGGNRAGVRKRKAARRTATERLVTLSEQDMKRWGISGFVGRSRLHAEDPVGHRAAASVLRHQRADHRRERHRQGTGRARDPLQQPARAGAVHSR